MKRVWLIYWVLCAKSGKIGEHKDTNIPYTNILINLIQIYLIQINLIQIYLLQI